jgi:putative oxidoreductase
MIIRRLDVAQPYVLSVFRMVVGLLFACHGVAGLFGVLGETSVSPGVWPDGYAALIELIGGALVLVGLATRFAALISSGAMAFAYFDVHQRHALLPIQNHGEASAMFCWAMLLLVFTGPGAWALDRLAAGRGFRG